MPPWMPFSNGVREKVQNVDVNSTADHIRTRIAGTIDMPMIDAFRQMNSSTVGGDSPIHGRSCRLVDSIWPAKQHAWSDSRLRTRRSGCRWTVCSWCTAKYPNALGEYAVLCVRSFGTLLDVRSAPRPDSVCGKCHSCVSLMCVATV